MKIKFYTSKIYHTNNKKITGFLKKHQGYNKKDEMNGILSKTFQK